jgi:hypothetical protein
MSPQLVDRFAFGQQNEELPKVISVRKPWEASVANPMKEIGEDLGDDVIFVSDTAASADEVTTR